MKRIARYLLENRLHLPLAHWTCQGFGFMRLRISDTMRLHIWDSRLREREVSDIHDHAQWDFESQIISGQLINTRYEIVTDDLHAIPYNMGTIICGIGGGMSSAQASDVKSVPLLARTPELYLPGSIYGQKAAEIHRTDAMDGTVTLIKQQRTNVDTARVFWPIGVAWGDAIPRAATRNEVDEIGEYALRILIGTGA